MLLLQDLPARRFLWLIVSLTVCCPAVARQDPPSEKTPSKWQVQQQWDESRDIETALRLMQELRDGPENQMTKNELLQILQWQLRFRAVDQAEKTFNLISEYATGEGSNDQFPGSLSGKLGAMPDKYDYLEAFINRPTLLVSSDARKIGLDRLTSWRVLTLARTDLPAAVELAGQFSIQPEDLEPSGQRDYRTAEYLCVNMWSTLFGLALAAEDSTLALEILEKFEHPRDQSTIKRFTRGEKIMQLPESESRKKLLSYFEVRKSWAERQKSISQFIKLKDFPSAEKALESFPDEPSRRMDEVGKLMKAYLHGDRLDDVNRWLDRIMEIANECRCDDRYMIEPFVVTGRYEDAKTFFGPLKISLKNHYSAVHMDRQPLGKIALKALESGNLLQASELVAAIEEPTWRSGAYAALSQAVSGEQPELSQEWWQESEKALQLIEDSKVHDLRLMHNYELLDIDTVQAKLPQLMERFNDPAFAAQAISTWLVASLERGVAPKTIMRSMIDQIAEIDPRQVENVVEQLQEKQQMEDCIYAALRLREDTEPAYFSYINYEFRSFFQYTKGHLSNEHFATIFDYQLAKHRGIIMMHALGGTKDDEQKSQVIEMIMERLEDTDMDVRLYSVLASHFIEIGDLDRLREILNRDIPADQFLDDDPEVFDWRVGTPDSSWLPARLAEKIGGQKMLEFARSLERKETRQVAYAQASQQVAIDQGLKEAAEVCLEILDRRERAELLLQVINRHLRQPRTR